MSAHQPWSPEKARQWIETRPWIRGFNYLPSTAVNSTEMWQAESFDPQTMDRELGWARELGYNAVRVFLPFLVWDADPEAFMERFDQFLRLAAEKKIDVAPIFFDDCAFSNRQPYLGPQDEPRPGIHNSGWTPSPGHDRAQDLSFFPRLREYVCQILEAHSADPRILFWDLYNEPGNAGMGEKSLPLLEAVFDWAQEVRPNQPLTAAPWEGPPSEKLNAVMLSRSDVLSVHVYKGLEETQKRLEEMSGEEGRPVMLTEWMARHLESRLETHLPWLQERQIPCIHWGLVRGKTQTHYPWESKEGDPEPTTWFHDILHPDGRAWNPEEVRLIRSCFQSEGR